MNFEAEAKSWLKQKEPRYIDKLEEMSRKIEVCLQKLDEDEKVVVDSKDGEPTGAGLCIVSSGAIEQAIMDVFGMWTPVKGVELWGKPKKYKYQHNPSHRVLRIGEITADGTYRQYNFGVQNRIYIIPRELENVMYGAKIKECAPGETIRDAQLGISSGWYPGITMTDFDELVECLTE